MGRQIKRQSVEVSYLVSYSELFEQGWLFGPEPNQTGLDRDLPRTPRTPRTPEVGTQSTCWLTPVSNFQGI